MTEQKTSDQRLGTPDTGAHDKKHGEKLKSASSPDQRGAGQKSGSESAGGAEDRQPRGDGRP